MIIYDIGLVFVCITTCFIACMCAYTLKSFINGHYNSTKTYILMPVWLVSFLDKYLIIDNSTYWYKQYSVKDGASPVIHTLLRYFMWCVVFDMILWFLWWFVLLVSGICIFLVNLNNTY